MIKDKETLQLYLDADRFALGCTNKRRFWGTKQVWLFEIVLRKYEYYHNTRRNLIKLFYYKFQYKRLSFKLGFSIPINVFGPGLRINHYGLIVVSDLCRVGKWCDIHQGVNIGDNGCFDEEGKVIRRVPTIGNYCFIGPGAKLFGDIHIGDENRIGANCVVNKSTPKEMTVFGNPMMMRISTNRHLIISSRDFETEFLKHFPQYIGLI